MVEEKNSLHEKGDVEIGLLEVKLTNADHHHARGKKMRFFPVLFDRSANTWWNPKFDSANLEEQHQKCLQPQTSWRFRWALIYIIVCCLVWSIFFGIIQRQHWIAFLVGTVILLLIVLVVLILSFTKFYQRIILQISLGIVLILCVSDLLSYVYQDPDLSPVGTFIGSIEILLLLYTFIPLPLYLCVGVGVLYSFIFELLSGCLSDMHEVKYIVCRALLHIAIHLIGIHIFLMSQVRKRSTFLKVCQSEKLRQSLQVEKRLKHCMINSLMPPKVAEEVMKARENDQDRENEEEEMHGSKKNRSTNEGPERGKMTFRSFHMSQMDNVSILFADIVGFTKMSSTMKNAEQLVYLLNDLFGRFDKICTECNCEKISTLGDCYYCVSGCPEKQKDHAVCCVEMGLKMCVAIMQFDRDHEKEVNMRVGVHTGTVLCGLVGTRRFKFDVWSHDVTLANMMESEGKPGRVHISDATYAFVKDYYNIERGEEVKDIRARRLLTECFDSKTQQFIVQQVEETGNIGTWFIVDRKSDCLNPMNRKSELNEMMIDSPDGVTETTNNEETKETTDPIDLSAVQLIGRKTSNDELINGEVNAVVNSTVVAQLLQSKQLQEKKEIEKDVEFTNLISERTQNYLYHPAINHWTLNFRSNKLEKKYRRHYTDDVSDVSSFASPHTSSLFDMFISVFFIIIISVCCFIGFEVRLPWVIVFIIAMVIELVFLILMFLNVSKRQSDADSLVEKIRNSFSSWYPRHFFGGILSSLPTIAVYSVFCCFNFSNVPQSDLFYSIIFISSLLHYCNFTMLSSWMKSCLATAAGIVLLILIGTGVCNMPSAPCNVSASAADCQGIFNVSTTAADAKFLFSGMHPLQNEIIIDMILFLLLVWFLNREIEISYRVCYHGDIEAMKDHQKIRTEEEQADWLLNNIVPPHVAEHLKLNKKYSKNHKDIGVIFAKICNFEDFYDESFEGGKEYLRVLNELMGDFEELFDDPKYKDVEKIKTIGSCLMAASGLNPQTTEDVDPNTHLVALMDFSIDILHKLDQFNKEIFNFDFEMSIGYNFGEVTAGVVGTTKLLYDIWGDTVNIASRMYSTGVHGRIQVPEETAVRLKDYYDFEHRDQVFVKGKGNMNVFLLAEKKKK